MEARQRLTVKEVTHVLRLSGAAIHKRLRNRGLEGLRLGAQGQFSREAINTGLANAAALQETKE